MRKVKPIINIIFIFMLIVLNIKLFIYKSGYSINAVNTILSKEKKNTEILHKNAYILGDRLGWKNISLDIENNASQKICIQIFFKSLKKKQNELLKIIPDDLIIKALFIVKNRTIIFVKGVDLQKISLTEKYYLEKIIKKNIRSFVDNDNENITIKFE